MKNLEEKNEKNRILFMCMTLTMLASMTSCGDSDSSSKTENNSSQTTTVASDASTAESKDESVTTSAPETSEKKVSYTTTELSYDADGNPIWNYIDDVPINKVVYKDDKITVTITKFAVEYDDEVLETAMGRVYVKIENNTDQRIQVYLKKYEINGVRMMSGWISSVTNYPSVSKVTEDCMEIDSDSMYANTGLNFNDIETITFEINICDDDTIENITDPIPFEIKLK